MIIVWSDEDDAYVVTVPDLVGCRTHGASYEEAARKGQEAIESWLDARRAWGREIPAPAYNDLGERFNPLNWPGDDEEAAPEAAGLAEGRD